MRARCCDSDVQWYFYTSSTASESRLHGITNGQAILTQFQTMRLPRFRSGHCLLKRSTLTGEVEKIVEAGIAWLQAVISK